MEHQKYKKPQTQTSKKTQPASPVVTLQNMRTFWLLTLTAVVIGFGSWVFMPSGGLDTDNLTDHEKTQIAKEYESVDTFSIERIVNNEEIKNAIASMQLSLDQKATLEEKVTHKELDMAWIQAWDNAAEDGDVLKFESQTYQVITTMMRKPVIFALPLSPGTNYVKVTGIHDGGGGITASVMTSSGAISVPVINTGTSYTLPIQ